MAEKEFSKTQIDKLGDRLRNGGFGEDDLRMLDEYRRSYGEAYEEVIGLLRNELEVTPTGRIKSTKSISDKLGRESVRLTQIQDIAGCRIVVTDIFVQNSTLEFLKQAFDNLTVIDRRIRPSHGYRAVHVIVNCLGKAVEIQVRTSLQHLWAEMSEKLSDKIELTIKYGGGDQQVREVLLKASAIIAVQDDLEVAINKTMVGLNSDSETSLQAKSDLLDIQANVKQNNETISASLNSVIQVAKNLGDQ